MRRILVVGLSALGEGLVRSLTGEHRSGHGEAARLRVYGVDRRQDRVDQLAHLSRVVVAAFDASDPLGLHHFLGDVPIDVGVVTIGGDFLEAERVAEALRLRTLPGGSRRRQVGRVIVTANRPYRSRILRALGHEVVEPVLDEARSLAVRVALEGLDRFSWIASPPDGGGSAFGVGEIAIPGRGLELPLDGLRERFPDLQVLGMRDRPGRAVVEPTGRLPSGAHLVVAGEGHRLAEAGRYLVQLAEEAGRGGGAGA